jgi:hypothetical protein
MMSTKHDNLLDNQFRQIVRHKSPLYLGPLANFLTRFAVSLHDLLTQFGPDATYSQEVSHRMKSVTDGANR